MVLAISCCSFLRLWKNYYPSLKRNATLRRLEVLRSVKNKRYNNEYGIKLDMTTCQLVMIIMLMLEVMLIFLLT